MGGGESDTQNPPHSEGVGEARPHTHPTDASGYVGYRPRINPPRCGRRWLPRGRGAGKSVLKDGGVEVALVGAS